MIGGSNNPITRISKNVQIYKKYLTEQQSTDESTANVGPATALASVGPIGGANKLVVRKHKKTNIAPTTEKAHVLLKDPNLVVIESTSAERSLLQEAGLNVNSEDSVHVVKGKGGLIKAAFAVKLNESNIVECINYIDVNPEGKNFKSGLARIISLPTCTYSFESNNVEVIENKIKDGLIVND